MVGNPWTARRIGHSRISSLSSGYQSENLILQSRNTCSRNVLHNPVIRKQLPSLIITPGVGQLGVFGAVLDILRPHPILHETEFSTGVEQMRGDGELQAVALALLRWEAGVFTIGLHRAPQRLPIDGNAAVGDESIR